MTDITLSWEDDEDPTTPRSALPAPARVLVAEDDDAFRLLVATRLRDEGYDVMQANSGGDALAMIHSAQLDEFPADGVDLLVVDHRMPGLTGLELVKKLHRLHSSIPVVLMTAFPDPALAAEAAQLGVTLLAKPFSLDALSATAVATLLARERPFTHWME